MSALVAPLVGAWVEMEARKTDGMRNFVAPLVGAWVEILNITEPQKVYMVAPLVGAWVEIWVELTIQPPSSGRSPRGSVG